MLWKRLWGISGILIGTTLSSANYAVETYVEGEAGYHNPCYEVHGPCPLSACTHWPLIGTDTPLPLPDEYCRTHGRGFVIGIQGGGGNSHWVVSEDNISNSDPGVTITPNTLTTTGVVGRVYLGFDFNHFFGIESGYTYLPNAGVDGTTNTQLVNGTVVNNSGSIYSNSVDVLAKLMWPVTNRFGFYAKAGGAYIHSSTSGFLIFSDGESQSETLNHVGFAGGVGIFYHIVTNFTADATWMRFYGNSDLFTNSENSDANTQPNYDTFMVGVSYKFEQKYVPSI